MTMQNCFLRILLIFVNFYLLCSTHINGYSFNESFFQSEISENQTLNEQNDTDEYATEYTEPDLSSMIIELDDYDNGIIISTNRSSVFALDAKITIENEQGNFSIPVLEIQNSHMLEKFNSNDSDSEVFFNYKESDAFPVVDNGSSSFTGEPFKNETFVMVNTNKTIFVIKSNYTDFEQHFLMNDSKSCQGNNFNGTVYCDKETEGRISCFLNSSASIHNKKQHFKPIHASVTSRKYIPQYSTKNSKCLIRITGDSSYYALHNYNIDKAISEVHAIFDKVNLILRSTDFDGDRLQDDFSLHIQGIILKGAANISNDYNKSYDFANLIDEYREVKQDSCMSLVFVAKPTELDLISTAYTGGICKNNWNEPDLARNIALINVVDSNGCKRSLIATVWTIAMAVGQVMGSVNRDCDPMVTFPSEELWSSFYSDCGRQNILNLLMTQGSCLKYPENKKHIQETRSKPKKIEKTVVKSSCGNGRLDHGEECDCGTQKQCKKMHSCCKPPGTKEECHYDRSRGYECDWTEDCCTRNCQIVPKSWNLFCGSGDFSCAPEGSYCDGKSSHCPVSKLKTNLMNGEMCGPGTLKQIGAATCQRGQCNSTVCQDAGLEDCMCAASTKMQCRVCCKESGSGQNISRPCRPAEYFGLNPKNSKLFYRYPGTTCHEVRYGHCDKDGKCVRLSRFQSLAVPQFSHLQPFIITSACVFHFIIALFKFY